MGFSYTAKNTILNGMTGRAQYATQASTCMIGVGVMEGDVFTEPDATTGYSRKLLGNYQSADSKCMGEPVQGNIRNAKIIYLPEAVADWGILSSTIQGTLLAVLLDESIARTAVELETMKTYPGCEALEQGYLNLRGFNGKRVVQSITPEFCAFLVDCYRVLRW